MNGTKTHNTSIESSDYGHFDSWKTEAMALSGTKQQAWNEFVTLALGILYQFWHPS